jgi:hypothetical protein
MAGRSPSREPSVRKRDRSPFDTPRKRGYSGRTDWPWNLAALNGAATCMAAPTTHKTRRQLNQKTL